jgi:hypothetical protein
MKDALLRLARNPAVRKALVALVVAIAAAFGISSGTGCGGASLPSAVTAKVAELECQIAAIETVVPRAAAEDLAMAARAGNVEYVIKQLLGLGVTPAKINAAGDAFRACSAPPSEPADAGAPPPDASIERS